MNEKNRQICHTISYFIHLQEFKFSSVLYFIINIYTFILHNVWKTLCIAMKTKQHNFQRTFPLTHTIQATSTHRENKYFCIVIFTTAQTTCQNWMYVLPSASHTHTYHLVYMWMLFICHSSVNLSKYFVSFFPKNEKK